MFTSPLEKYLKLGSRPDEASVFCKECVVAADRDKVMEVLDRVVQRSLGVLNRPKYYTFTANENVVTMNVVAVGDSRDPTIGQLFFVRDRFRLAGQNIDLLSFKSGGSTNM